LAQWAAQAAQSEAAVDSTPEALPQRMNERAGAFLQDRLPLAFAPLPTGDRSCAEALLAPFARVPSAASPGFGLPESLKAQFPGAGGRGSKAGAKSQLGWDSQSHSFAPLALVPWHGPANQ
jgi:hypothetical protein